eukprot:COSAG05_NODE_4048_length_1699_cov_10.785317_1_plen_35_part_00
MLDMQLPQLIERPYRGSESCAATRPGVEKRGRRK